MLILGHTEYCKQGAGNAPLLALVQLTSIVLKLDQDMSYPNIWRYTSFVIPWHFRVMLSWNIL